MEKNSVLVQITKWSGRNKTVLTSEGKLPYIEWLKKEFEKIISEGRVGEIRCKNGMVDVVALFANNLVVPNKERWREIYRNGRSPRPYNRAV